MNRQLKRIEQTLKTLEKGSANQGAATLPQPAVLRSEIGFSKPLTTAKTSVSFEVSRSQVEAIPPTTTTSKITPQPVAPFITEPSVDEVAMGAKFQLPNFVNQPSSGNFGFSTHQNGSNPDIAINLLQESLKTIESWRSELTQVGHRIQTLYREGPIVDGWLECSTKKVDNTTQVLRHAEINQLMDYVDQLCNDPFATHPEYRLCGLNDEGKTWSSPCPPDQIASLSLAISRHQKLKPLLIRKIELEKKLGHAAEEIVKMQSRINGTGS